MVTDRLFTQPALEALLAIAKLSKQLRNDLRDIEAIPTVAAAMAQQSMSQNATALAKRVLNVLKATNAASPASRQKIKRRGSSRGSVSSPDGMLGSRPVSPASTGSDSKHHTSCKNLAFSIESDIAAIKGGSDTPVDVRDR